MWFDGIRQPNTLYVANTSCGKDSSAMLKAIQILGWPLDAIVTVDVWATQDIPAELPPMVSFKEHYGKRCEELFGLPLTRICATKRERERERDESADRECHSRISYEDMFYSTMCHGKFVGTIKGFPMERGSWCKKLKTQKVDIRGHLLSSAVPQERERIAAQQLTERRIPNLRIPNALVELVHERSQSLSTQGFPNQGCRWCTGELKRTALGTTAFRSALEAAGIGVQPSKPLPSMSAEARRGK